MRVSNKVHEYQIQQEMIRAQRACQETHRLDKIHLDRLEENRLRIERNRELERKHGLKVDTFA